MPKRRPEHQPQRTCAVCREVHPKRSMTRVVRQADGAVMVDPSGKAPDRFELLRLEELVLGDLAGGDIDHGRKDLHAVRGFDRSEAYLDREFGSILAAR